MFENVIEAMVDAVLVIDAEGRVTAANTAACTLTGYTRAQLLGQSIARLVIDDSSGMHTVVRRRIEDGDVLRREVSWLVTRTDEKIPVSVTGSPVLDARGALQGIVMVARDVREVRRLLVEKEEEIERRKRAEEQLRATNASIEEQLEHTREQLLLAERRATLGTLAGGVGHELKNIAQVQVAAVDELRVALESGENLRDMLRATLPDLDRVGEHITAHGQRLLQLARPGPDHVGPIDLNGVPTDIVAMLRGAGRLRRIEVTTRLAAEPIIVTVNRTRIEQILVNLIVNAIDAIGDGPGQIAIAVAPSADGARVVCEVSDTGTGIPPDVLARIFDPFFTTKAEGTGLGLPVVREIVESYGGALKVSSVVGEGTTFTFDLPR
jgi:PAS domain S-box-containing protein